MTSQLLQFAIIEQNFLHNELRWLQAGGSVISRTGEDLSPKKMSELVARLESADRAIRIAKEGVHTT